MARDSSPLRSLRLRLTGIGCLERGRAGWEVRGGGPNSTLHTTHFFASNQYFPNSFGIISMTLSSHRNVSCSATNLRFASYGACLPFNFSTPTTRAMNLMSLDGEARRSLYCLCGVLEMRQTEVVGGGGRGGNGSWL